MIHRIEQRRGHIRVEATDNIQVTRVRVTILDEDGKVLENWVWFKISGERTPSTNFARINKCRLPN